MGEEPIADSVEEFQEYYGDKYDWVIRPDADNKYHRIYSLDETSAKTFLDRSSYFVRGNRLYALESKIDGAEKEGYVLSDDQLLKALAIILCDELCDELVSNDPFKGSSLTSAIRDLK